MVGAAVTEAEVRAILTSELAVDGPVTWIHKSDDAWAEASLIVRQPRRDISLSLRLTLNLLARHKFSISLLLDGSHRIAGIDVGGGHENRHTDRNRWVNATHEHVWTDLCHGTWAVELNAFPDDIRRAFPAFCNKFNVQFSGTWADPPAAQLDLDI